MSAGDSRRWTGFESRPLCSDEAAARSESDPPTGPMTVLGGLSGLLHPWSAMVSRISEGFESRPQRSTSRMPKATPRDADRSSGGQGPSDPGGSARPGARRVQRHCPSPRGPSIPEAELPQSRSRPPVWRPMRRAGPSPTCGAPHVATMEVWMWLHRWWRSGCGSSRTT